MIEPSPAWASAVREGRWADFAGLPRDVAEQTLLHELGRSRSQMARHTVMLGQESRVLADTEAFRYWLDHEDNVVLVELENTPSATPLPEALAALGKAEREDIGRHRRYGALTTEYVYPQRGLALTVGESYDDPPTFAPFLVSVQLFAPTDLQGFITSLGGEDLGGLHHRYR